MANFNLNEYETVKSRKEKFYTDYSDGRIVVRLVNPESVMEKAVFEARVYISLEDQKVDCPRGVGYALEIRDVELARTREGKTYETVNYSSWTENCEESAVGRALDNAGYSGNKKPSREEMEKAERMTQTINNNQQYSPTHEVADCANGNHPSASVVEMRSKFEGLDKGRLMSYCRSCKKRIDWLEPRLGTNGQIGDNSEVNYDLVANEFLKDQKEA